MKGMALSHASEVPQSTNPVAQPLLTVLLGFTLSREGPGLRCEGSQLQIYPPVRPVSATAHR
jgi:hypothetical protein